MTKVVYNACYGGFSLSDVGVKRYAEIKGIKLYPEDSGSMTTYWTIPQDQRVPKPLQSDRDDNRWKAFNADYDAHTIYSRDFDRTDPVLVQVVEELGSAADGACAELKIADLPAGTKYRITEYDGYEGIETSDEVDWQVAS